jgi:hypothetical protein
VALPFTNAKEELLKFKYFTMQKYKLKKKSLKLNKLNKINFKKILQDIITL